MTDLPFPLSGSTLVTGPSNAGKTRLTAAALDAWVDANGPEGVVVIDFAPVVERDGDVLGGRLTQFTSVPDDAWYGVLEAHAPRAEGADEAAALALARDNAARAARLLDAAPDPRAAFVNDATIPYQADGDPSPLTAYCDRAGVAVLNAFDSDELGDDDPVSRGDRAALAALDAWADRRVRLDGDPEPPDI
ncbi:MAG: hypothetical protein ABEH47_09290 [Haloferacaceae archaeon]